MSLVPDPSFVVVPFTMAAQVEKWGASWGWIDLKWDTRENLAIVCGFSDKEAKRLPYTDLFERGHYLRSADRAHRSGVWYRVREEAHDVHRAVFGRRLAVPVEVLKEQVLQGWRQPPPQQMLLVLTLTHTDEDDLWSAWWVNGDTAAPGPLSVVRDDLNPLGYVATDWPLDTLLGVTALIVGVGSIGSGAAEALAASGVGRMALVDPDRLLQHNLPRHRLTERDLGRFKVNALAERLRERFPHVEAVPYVADVNEDADIMRPLFSEADVIVCASDGVLSRRVTNHLARRAGKPAVFAAVLEDGAFGEIVRVRPRTGCLLCLRRALVAADVLDPEPALDADYGTGSPHRPMTAAPDDLRLVGELASKVALSTVLERSGHWTHRLPGDWAVIGLQPVPDFPEPFDDLKAGEIRWRALPDVDLGCPTCTPP